MTLLAFAASNSRHSINRALVDHVLARYRAEVVSDADVKVLDLNDFEMPIFSIDRENATGIPPQAQAFFDEIGAADKLLISFAEHNGSSTAAWKNLFDWMSRIDAKVWQGKPMAIMAATPGGRAGAGVLGAQSATAPFFGGDIKASVGIGRWQEAYDAETGALTRPEDVAAIDEVLAVLAADT